MARNRLPDRSVTMVASQTFLLLALIAVNKAAAFVSPGAVGARSTVNSPGPNAVSSSSDNTGNTAGTKTRSEDRTPSWRYEVDDLIKAASPWGSLVETEIIATDLLKRLPEIARDVSSATRRNELISGIVLGEGTEARFTVNGLKAVNRQVRQDIIPQALEVAPRIVQAVPRPGTRTRVSSPTTSSSSSMPSTRASRRKGPMEGVAEALYSIKNTAKSLSPNRVRKGLETVAAETENIFSRTPKGLYSPEFTREDVQEQFEVRRYVSYAVCSATMDDDLADFGPEALNGDTGVTLGSGEGFNTLAGYLFGNNTQEVAMDMTTPVNIDVDASGRTMSFVMPKDIPAGEAPTPRDPRVNVKNIAEGELLAVREFPGFATDGEVARQLDSVFFALSAPTSAWSAEDPTAKSYRLMQYNPPYTLPWQRTNAIAVKVHSKETGNAAKIAERSVESRTGGPVESDGVREQVSSTISQSTSSS